MIFDISIVFDLSYLDFLDLRHPWLGDIFLLRVVLVLLEYQVQVQVLLEYQVQVQVLLEDQENTIKFSPQSTSSASQQVSRATIILHSIP